jgi:hypothetical protein
MRRHDLLAAAAAEFERALAPPDSMHGVELYLLSPCDLYALGRMCLSGWDQWCFPKKLDVSAGWRLMREAAKKGHSAALHVLARLEASSGPVPLMQADEGAKSSWVAQAFDGDSSALGCFYRGAAALACKGDKNFHLLATAAAMGDGFSSLLLYCFKRTSALRDALPTAERATVELRELLERVDINGRHAGDAIRESVWAGAILNHPQCMARMAGFHNDSFFRTGRESDLFEFCGWTSRRVMWLFSDWSERCRMPPHYPATDLHIATCSAELRYIIGFHLDQIHHLAPHRFAHKRETFQPALDCYRQTACACRRATLATLWALKQLVHRDVVRVIGRMIWATRHNVRLWYVPSPKRAASPAATTLEKRTPVEAAWK